MAAEKLKIVFLGTPEFAVASLNILLKNNYEIAAVVTAPDQPSGRGLQLSESAVKKFAVEHGLKIFQPVKLKDELFLAELKKINANLQIVVAFRMMPVELWNMPSRGTFNLHASLLPQYRGAAPINRAIMNGEKQTGVTTFFLKHEIDTGNILFNESILIGDHDTAGDLHDRLMTTGAELVLKTVKAIESNTYREIPQSDAISGSEILKTAPKIFKEDCKIKWNQKAEIIYNHIRGLSPYPTAFTELCSPDNKILQLKIYKGDKEIVSTPTRAGTIQTDGKTFLKIVALDGLIKITELQLAGKKKMAVEDFLRGSAINESWKVNF